MRGRSITVGAAGALLAVLLAGGCGSGTNDEFSSEEIQRDIDEAFADVTSPTAPVDATGDDPTTAADEVEEVLGDGGDASSGSSSTLTDNTGVLTATIPSEWTERDITPTSGGSPSLRAAPSLAEFGSGGAGIGITAAFDGTDVATALSQIEESIEGQTTPAPSDCSSSRDADYGTPNGLAGTVEVFEGCGGDADAAWAFLSLAPTAAGESGVVAVYGFMTTVDEVNQFFDVVDSIEVSP